MGAKWRKMKEEQIHDRHVLHGPFAQSVFHRSGVLAALRQISQELESSILDEFYLATVWELSV